jgi:hypothetical protein
MAYLKVYQQIASEGKGCRASLGLPDVGVRGYVCIAAFDRRVARHHRSTLGLGFRLQADLAVLHFNCVFHGLTSVLFSDLISFLLHKRREALDVASH